MYLIEGIYVNNFGEVVYDENSDSLVNSDLEIFKKYGVEYLTKQISECNHLMQLLTALDDYFKSAPMVENRSRIKGLKMELTSLKNCIVKTNQRKAEYTALIEEEEQLKKLGITQ
jgi:hypothetical protein